jgi:hypothetical protein
MKVRKMIMVIICVCICFINLFGKDEDKKNEISIIEEWRETLLYGIADELMKVIDRIKEARETSLNPELVGVLAESINTEVRKTILYYFIDLSCGEAESVALSLLKDPESLESTLIIALLDYCAAIRASGLSDLIEAYVTGEDDIVAIAAINAIGTMSDTSKKEFLIERFKDDEFSEKRKSTIITNLGKLKAQEAVPVLIGIVEDTYAEKMWRMYACEALGKIGDESAIPVLKKVFSEKDALLRAYAASALASFNMDEVIDLLIQGLKDSNARVRYHCAQALASKDAVEAIDILIYKAKKDPDVKVRKEAVKALGSIGREKCFVFIRELYLKENENLELRGTCLEVLLERDVDGSLSSIVKLVERDWMKKSFDSKAFEMTARICSTKKAKQLKPVYAAFLTHKSNVIRVYGIRGAALNNLKELRSIIEKLSKDDPVYIVRKEALAALAKF